jgi:hypothetical protein
MVEADRQQGLGCRETPTAPSEGLGGWRPGCPEAAGESRRPGQSYAIIRGRQYNSEQRLWPATAPDGEALYGAAGEIGRVGQPFPLGGCRRNNVRFMPRQNLAQADGLLIDRIKRDAAWRRPLALKHTAVLGDRAFRLCLPYSMPSPTVTFSGASGFPVTASCPSLVQGAGRHPRK